MTLEAIYQRAARDQLKHAGGTQVTYTPKDGSALADPVWALVLRDLERERTDTEVVVLERIHAADLLSAEVPKPRRGDRFTDGSTTWEVDDVMEDNGYIVQVKILEVTGG